MAYRVPFVDPGKNYEMIREEIDSVYREVMSAGDLIMRSQLEDFERSFASFVGVRYAVGLNSGYHGLYISMLAAGVGRGDEVIVPAHTFLATASAVVNAGGTPVLVDVGKDYNIDPDRVEEAITERTKAIVPVHLNGRMARMDRIETIASKHGLTVIEDACQSLGATYKGRSAGSIGLTGCWSFYPFKMLGGYGDGGAITTNDPDVARMARLYRFNGEDRETGEYHMHGETCLLDNLQAAFLQVKLARLPGWIERRRAIASKYNEGLSNTGIGLPHFDDEGFEDVYQNYVVRTERRDELQSHLRDRGVEVLVHWPKPYYHHAALEIKDRGFPETESISREVLSLPMNVEITDEQVDYVIESIRSFFE